MECRTIRNIPLEVTKESIVRCTEFKAETTPIESMRRMEEGRSPHPVYVTEEELNLNDRFQRKALLAFMVNEMTRGQYSASALKDAQRVIAEELETVVKEMDDDLPFH